MYSDDYIAELLRREASNRYGTASVASSRGPPTVKSINKTFLANTILSTEAHNRREEIADCWRQHDMMKKSRGHDVVSREVVRDSRQVRQEDEANREYWMNRKVCLSLLN